MERAIAAFFLLLIVFFSGCSTNTGQVVETTKMTTLEPSQPQQDTIEEIHKDFEEFEKSQANPSQEPEQEIQEESESLQEPQPTKPPEEETPSLEPEPSPECLVCNDSDPCTQDLCSEETSYECAYKATVPCCGNGECENGETPERCLSDCLKICALQCEACETLDTEACACLPNECTSGDSCCPQGCNYTADSDCTVPDACSSDQGCDDSNPCTVDTCSGKPKKCHYSEAECQGEDRCCPDGCDYMTDSDCPEPVSSVIFSEVYYNPQGSDDEYEWIEVYNNGTIGVDLTKWRFEESGTQHKINSLGNASVLEPDSYAVIADNATVFLIDYPEFSSLVFDSVFSLNNTGEETILKTGMNGNISDSLLYDSAWGGNGNGFSLEKIDPNGSNTRENWNQSLAEKGTPGQKNSIAS